MCPQPGGVPEAHPDAVARPEEPQVVPEERLVRHGAQAVHRAAARQPAAWRVREALPDVPQAAQDVPARPVRQAAEPDAQPGLRDAAERAARRGVQGARAVRRAVRHAARAARRAEPAAWRAARDAAEGLPDGPAAALHAERAARRGALRERDAQPGARALPAVRDGHRAAGPRVHRVRGAADRLRADVLRAADGLRLAHLRAGAGLAPQRSRRETLGPRRRLLTAMSARWSQGE